MPTFPKITESSSTRTSTRLSSRRPSINTKVLSLPTRPRRSICRPLVYSDSESDSDPDENESKDQSFRNVHVVPNKSRTSISRKSLVARRAKKADNTKENDMIGGTLEKINEETTPEKLLFLSPKKKKVPKPIYESDQDSQELSSPTKSNLTPRKQKCMQNIENIGYVTPPKQKKQVNCENVPLSPSSLLKQLQLNSPKKYLDEVPESTKGVFINARRALDYALPREMPGREKEHDDLRSFIKKHLKDQSSGTLYVSGPPGTGKTASLSKILKEPDIEFQFEEVFVNCTAMKSSGSIYSRIVNDLLGLKSKGKSEKECIAAIERYLERKHKMILLVLDEIDQLESKNQSVLYTIFEWPSRPGSKLVLVGIANALDLTDRILPRLQARCELKPQLMHFAPYSKAQIIDIFTNRLKNAGVLHLFQPEAVQILAGKVAAISGDVRRALDIGRRVVELVERHKKQETFKSIENQTHPSNVSNIDKIVDLKHVVGVLNSVYGTTNTLDNDDEDDTFPLQQKIVVCTLLLVLKKARNKDVTIGKLHDVYKKVCTKRNLLALDQAEFVGLCSLIEAKGIIRVSGRKDPRLLKVTMEWDDEEVSSALKDKQLMSIILQDDSVLGKM